MMSIIRNQQNEIMKLKKNEIKRVIYKESHQDTLCSETALAYKSNKISEDPSLVKLSKEDIQATRV